MACCRYFVKIASVTESTSFVILNPESTQTFTDKQKICFKIPSAVSSASASLPVYIVANGENVPLWDKYGDSLTGSELRKCKCYSGFFGTGTANHVLIHNAPITCNVGV